MTYEIRTADLWPDVDYELRAASDGLTFEGYAAVYELPSVPMAFAGVRGGQTFREIIQPGAFTKTLGELPDVTLRVNHDMLGIPLARTKSGTMTLSEDARGLRVAARLPDNSHGQIVRDAILRGDVSGMSFRFQKVRDEWTKDAAGNVRTLREVKLGPEVSVVDLPAYPDTIATVRALALESDVDPEELVSALSALKPESRLTAAQRDVVIAVINSHSEAPVMDATAAHKLAQMRERLAALA